MQSSWRFRNHDQDQVNREALTGTFWKVFIVLMALAAVASVAGYFYWKSFEDTPQYSLALLVDAAHKDDQASVQQLVDTDAVVEAFIPQVTEKAAGLYGRGLPKDVLSRLSFVARPLMPAIKERAKAELPRLIRKETDRFSHVPFAGFVLGADQYLLIDVKGETATVRSNLPEHSFEVKMLRSGSRWKIVSVTDDDLSTRIAQAIGQEIIGIAASGELTRAGERLGVENLQDLIRQAEAIFE